MVEGSAMRVLVTGSAGFVGRHTVAAFTERGDEVHTFDKQDGQDLGRGGWQWPEVDAIVHLAASCSTPGSVARPFETFWDTVLTTARVLEAARDSGTPVILTSSVKARDGKTPYGAAKRMSELWAEEYRTAYSLPVVINRPGTIYGPGQAGSPESGWIAWFCEARAASVPVILNGDGQQVRDLLHVSDYVKLLVKQAMSPKTYSGQIYDVGGGEANAVTVQQIADHLGPIYSYGPERYGDARSYVGLNDAPDWAPQGLWRESETLGEQHD
ncbi:MAG: NAD-dependent epimerase/dehydratase family protein [Gemmatimonadales bacterium]|nr:MAG: NAD-dependent epimerase/dehydratase family protein [Gemmatimonadales bacterium]